MPRFTGIKQDFHEKFKGWINDRVGKWDKSHYSVFVSRLIWDDNSQRYNEVGKDGKSDAHAVEIKRYIVEDGYEKPAAIDAALNRELSRAIKGANKNAYPSFDRIMFAINTENGAERIQLIIPDMALCVFILPNYVQRHSVPITAGATVGLTAVFVGLVEMGYFSKSPQPIFGSFGEVVGIGKAEGTVLQVVLTIAVAATAAALTVAFVGWFYKSAKAAHARTASELDIGPNSDLLQEGTTGPIAAT